MLTSCSTDELLTLIETRLSGAASDDLVTIVCARTFRGMELHDCVFAATLDVGVMRFYSDRVSSKR